MEKNVSLVVTIIGKVGGQKIEEGPIKGAALTRWLTTGDNLNVGAFRDDRYAVHVHLAQGEKIIGDQTREFNLSRDHPVARRLVHIRAATLVVQSKKERQSQLGIRSKKIF